jgi:nucleoside-diphosphate-sugar epimerase
MKRVLVTGPNGFIGRHCLPGLQEKGYELHGVVPRAELKLELPNVQWHVADLLDPESIRSLMKTVSPTHLLHFAWYTQPGEYWTSSENLRWLQAGLEILQAFKVHGGRRVLMAGSCAEYDWRYGFCSERLTPLSPATLYGACKKSLYEILMKYANQEGLSAAWGRVFFLYGPHEHPSRLVPSIINAIYDQRPAPCTQGDQIRDFLHVEDVASAFAALLDSQVEDAVNIASGRPVTVNHIIRRIAEKLGRLDLIQFGAIPIPATEPPVLLADVTRLQRDLGWFPSNDLETGLDKTIEWWKARRIPA